jgi:hypothetical protein
MRGFQRLAMIAKRASAAGRSSPEYEGIWG